MMRFSCSIPEPAQKTFEKNRSILIYFLSICLYVNPLTSNEEKLTLQVSTHLQFG